MLPGSEQSFAKAKPGSELGSLEPRRSTYLTEASCFSLFALKIYLFTFRERGRTAERQGEKHQCVVASHTPLAEDLPATQACALTGNQTSDPLVPRPALNPLSHTSQDCLFKKKKREEKSSVFLSRDTDSHPFHSCRYVC